MGGLVSYFAFDDIWNVGKFTYYSLLALQNRGQTITGMYLNGKEGIRGRTDATKPENFSIEGLEGFSSIGYVGVRDSFPIADREVAVAVDGVVKVKDLLGLSKRVFSDPSSAKELAGKTASFIAMNSEGAVAAYRGSLGLQPLVIGGFGFDMAVVASEPTALAVTGSDFRREIRPGELVIIDKYGIESFLVEESPRSYCSIEFVYQARLDSFVNETDIYSMRLRIGERLAEEFPISADTVIGVPETALPFALGYSRATGIPMDLGFVRTGSPIRTMISVDAFLKLVGVQLKLNPIKSAVKGKRVVLIDDSMVTGNTLKNTVFNLRSLGAKEVHVLIGSPKIISSCPYGVEIPEDRELIAANLDDHKIALMIGADSIHWLSLEGLNKAIGTSSICTGCFTRRYPV